MMMMVLCPDRALEHSCFYDRSCFRASAYITGGQTIQCGGQHMILERNLRARHPVCMIFNCNSTMPQNDKYLIIPSHNYTTVTKQVT